MQANNPGSCQDHQGSLPINLVSRHHRWNLPAPGWFRNVSKHWPKQDRTFVVLEEEQEVRSWSLKCLKLAPLELVTVSQTDEEFDGVDIKKRHKADIWREVTRCFFAHRGGICITWATARANTPQIDERCIFVHTIPFVHKLETLVRLRRSALAQAPN